MENNLTYTMNGDYQIPDLKLTEQPEKPLGKYGRMRKAYLKDHRPLIYNQLLLTEKLYPHLLEIDETANSRLEQMMPQLAAAAGATEQLKARDPMKWVGLMNTCKAQAEEILMAELILMFLTVSPFVFVAMKTKGFVAPMIGSAVIVMGSAALSNQEWGALYPWTATYFLVQGKLQSTGYPTLLSVSIIILVSAVGFLMTFHHFKKEDLK